MRRCIHTGLHRSVIIYILLPILVLQKAYFPRGCMIGFRRIYDLLSKRATVLEQAKDVKYFCLTFDKCTREL